MTDRYDLIAELCSQGQTFQEIADALCVSRQRAYQLVHHGRGKELGLPSIREHVIKRRRAVEVAETRDRWHHKYGVELPSGEFRSDVLRAEQHHRLLRKKANSKREGVDFDLTWGDLEWPSNCPVLNIPIDYFTASGARTEASCSFDRLDSTLGYVKGNVRVISWRANRIKNDGTAEEHRKIAEYIDRFV